MSGHRLRSIGQYTLHPSQYHMVEANIAAGNAVSICECGSVIIAPERYQVDRRHKKHIMAVIAASEFET